MTSVKASRDLALASEFWFLASFECLLASNAFWDVVLAIATLKNGSDARKGMILAKEGGLVRFAKTLQSAHLFQSADFRWTGHVFPLGSRWPEPALGGGGGAAVSWWRCVVALVGGVLAVGVSF